MNAGLSPRIGTKAVKALVIRATRTPVVEVDTEATAAYVRFSRAKVARTVPFGGKNSMAMVDLDQKGHVIDEMSPEARIASRAHRSATRKNASSFADAVCR